MQNSIISSYNYGGLPPSTYFDQLDAFNDEINNYNQIVPSPSTYIPVAMDHSRSLQLKTLQDLVDRRNKCVSKLRSTTKEMESLRQENVNLQMLNRELNRRLNLLLENITQASVSDAFSGMRIVGEKGVERGGGTWDEGTSVSADGVNVDRVKMPKSISVRSGEYLKKAGLRNGGGQGTGANRSRKAQNTKVYVQGGKAEEQALELQVYNQGVSKTELCNKWQQTGQCPYNDQCHFAHGIEELRPVLRHPRYKTEVCRMVLNGDQCPYGHRCHFRHSLTEEEKLVANMGRNLNM